MAEQLKFIRGVIYDTDLEQFKDEMFHYMAQRDEKRNEEKIKEIIKGFQEDAGYTEEEAKSYFCGADTICALTRYNPITCENNNLIIPKEALSTSLVDELELVDLGKDLLEEYTTQCIEKSKARKVTPEEICEDDDILSLLENVDQDKLIKIPKDSPLGKAIGKILGIA